MSLQGNSSAWHSFGAAPGAETSVCNNHQFPILAGCVLKGHFTPIPTNSKDLTFSTSVLYAFTSFSPKAALSALCRRNIL